MTAVQLLCAVRHYCTVCLLLQLMYHSADNVQFAVLKVMSLSYQLLSVAWISSRTVVLIDTLEQAHVIDVQSANEMEVIDLTDIGLVYSTCLWKLLASSSGLGHALLQAGSHLCYESVASFGEQLLILGTNGIHVFSVRTWLERLNVLVRRRQFGDALTLARSFYNAAKPDGVVSSGESKRRDAVAERILELIAKYMDHVDAVSSLQSTETANLYHVCIPSFTLLSASNTQ